ncbi:MAG: DUF3775 domain-containing protein [Hyphomicrobiaceae bacterium]|nr:DUF3775 domain-containing protein [Hyphomicrobiaceae bacterium]
MAVDEDRRAQVEIAPEKVAHVIVRAREIDAKVGAWDDTAGSPAAAEDDADQTLEDLASDPTRDELAEFIAALNLDEQTHLVALTWVGRGSFEPEDYQEAVETARNERVNATETYLLGIPLLADYLEDGLERMGFNIEDVEDGIL